MMKLSFSINGWKGYSWNEFVELAKDNYFKGIELHNVLGSELTEKNGPFHQYNSVATMRELRDNGISVPCFDISVDISSAAIDKNVAQINECSDFASAIKAPYISV